MEDETDVEKSDEEEKNFRNDENEDLIKKLKLCRKKLLYLQKKENEINEKYETNNFLVYLKFKLETNKLVFTVIKAMFVSVRG